MAVWVRWWLGALFFGGINLSLLAARGILQPAKQPSAQWLQAVVAMAPSALIATDREQRIVLFNRRSEEIFGYTEQEVLGKPIRLLLPELPGRRPWRGQGPERRRAWGERASLRRASGHPGARAGRTPQGWQFVPRRGLRRRHPGRGRRTRRVGGAQHLRSQAGPGGAEAACQPGRADGVVQPPGVPGGAGALPRARAPPPGARGAAFHGPRPAEVRQRHARAPGRRPGAGARCRDHPGPPAAHRHRGPPRRRRVRHPHAVHRARGGLRSRNRC